MCPQPPLQANAQVLEHVGTKKTKGENGHLTNDLFQADVVVDDDIPAACAWDEVVVSLSDRTCAIRNPIREITEGMSPANPEKREISLSLGDPATAGLASAPEVARHALEEALWSQTRDGYTNSCGAEDARVAIGNSSGADAHDVFITNGCSQALQHVFAALAAPRANILIPRPCFPLYEVLAAYYGIECRHYELNASSGWRCDPVELGQLADAQTAAILVCNPGNPTGACFSAAHLREIALAARHARVPIIADEVYAGIAWADEAFTPMSQFAKDDIVPVIEVGALSKRFVVPGWRLGWTVLHDVGGVFARSGLRVALTKLQQISLSACSLVQAAVPAILRDCPESYHKELNASLRLSAEHAFHRARTSPYLICPSEPPCGAMYLMLRIDLDALDDTMSSDIDFVDMLGREESVRLLPGSCFGLPNYVRIVFAAKHDDIDEAFDRIDAFCKRHGQLAEAL